MFTGCIIIVAVVSFCLVSSLELKFDGTQTAFSALRQGQGEERSSPENHNKVNVRSETTFMMKIMEEYSHKKDIQVKGIGCGCEGYSCNCCAEIINVEVCMKITFTDRTTLVTDLMCNGTSIYTWISSASDPQSFCSGSPHMNVCIKCYDFNVTDNRFHSCLKFEVTSLSRVSQIVNLGCFNIPQRQMKSANKTLITGL